MPAIQLLITDIDNSQIAYQPEVESGIDVTWERRSAPGKLTFSVVKDSTLKLARGSQVSLTVDSTPMFFGYLFGIEESKSQIIKVTCYDQLRYLKNKDTYKFEGYKANEIIAMIAEDFGLKVGELEDTGYVIASYTKDNKELFDIIEGALDLTLTTNKVMYVMYDDFGRIMLKSLANMGVGTDNSYLLIDAASGQDFQYTASIDSETYNQIKLVHSNSETGTDEIYMAKDSSHINTWGTLQYYDTIEDGENGQVKADALLSLYNAETKNLKFKKVFGDIRVRGGSMVVVSMSLHDTTIQNFMMVEKVKHTFNAGEHWMELTLRGGDFVA